jgi:DNA-binding NtrC family response regulator
LRFLQLPIFNGDSVATEHTNIRIMFGTFIGLEGEVDTGRFREDLFYRLKVARVALKPLRDRSAALPDIAQAVINHITHDQDDPSRTLAEVAASILSRLSWHGNLVSLQAVLTQAMQNHRSKVLRAEMLPEAVLAEFVDATQASGDGSAVSIMDDADTSVGELIKAGWSLAKLERLVVEMAISQNGGSVPKAARMLDVSPSTLYRKREAWALNSP